MRNSQAGLSRKTRDAGGRQGSEFLKFPFYKLAWAHDENGLFKKTKQVLKQCAGVGWWCHSEE